MWNERHVQNRHASRQKASETVFGRAGVHEEIAFALTQRASIHGAAAVCCRALATKYSRSADQQAGDTRVMYSQISKAYAAKAIQLEATAAMQGAGAATAGGAGAGAPFAGGISVTDLINRQNDTDRMPPIFSIGMTD